MVHVMKPASPWAAQCPYEGGLKETVALISRQCSPRSIMSDTRASPSTHWLSCPFILVLSAGQQHISSFHEAIILYCVLEAHMGQDTWWSLGRLAFHFDASWERQTPSSLRLLHSVNLALPRSHENVWKSPRCHICAARACSFQIILWGVKSSTCWVIITPVLN